MEKQAGATGDVTAWGRSDGRTKHRIGPSWHPSAVSDGAIRARHVPRGLCLSTPSGVVGAHVDGLLQVTWQPGEPGYLPDSPDSQYQADISPTRRERGERSPGESRIHSGSRHYHQDGNCTDDTGRRWISKRTSLPDSFISHADGAHHPDHTTSWTKSHANKPPEHCNSAPCKGPIRDEKGFA